MSDLIERQAAIDAPAREMPESYDNDIEVADEAFADAIQINNNLPATQPAPQWVPVIDGDGQMPEVDEEGWSDYILLSFSNADFVGVGLYREDEDGGAFYGSIDTKPLTWFNLFVNAWMKLPEKYHDTL